MKPTKADEIERIAKTLFDKTHSVFDIHDYPWWPRWVSPCQIKEYRTIAEWHLKQMERGRGKGGK